MQGLVRAEGDSLKSQSSASKDWSKGIATAYGTGAKNGALFTVKKQSPKAAKALAGLTQAVNSGVAVGSTLLLTLNPNDPANQLPPGSSSTTPPSSNPGGDLVTSVNAADDAFDQANADAETKRVTDVTGVRDTLDTQLGTADATWGGTMDSAGAALGSALDGIQDFDWQHVRNYVGTVTGARKAAELGALSAQVSFVGSYYNSLNSYTASIATAGVAHAALYAQATATYFTDTADQEATTAEAAVTTAITNGASASEITALTATATAKRAKADAFATFATTYVTHLTTQAQSAATTAVTNVTTANTTALATITTEVATATTDINTFYDTQVTTAANPPPVDTDLNNDGIADPPTPTATQSITASITAAKTANTTARTAVHTAFNDQTARRTTSTTNTPVDQNTSSGATSGGGNTSYTEPTPPPNGTPPAASPPANNSGPSQSQHPGGVALTLL